jgi:hypothetical protein
MVQRGSFVDVCRSVAVEEEKYSEVIREKGVSAWRSTQQRYTILIPSIEMSSTSDD